jgi:hygromycin-B 7''-O-kinase
MHSLPSLSNFEAFQAWRADPSRCLPAAFDIARSHGLPHADPQVFPTGTNLVVGLDDRLILKVFPPLLRSQFVSERIALAQLRGKLSVPIPEIVLEANATDGRILSSRVYPACWAPRRGPCCRKTKRSACWLRSG